MKKILKIMLSAVIVCITAITVSLCAYAETEDVELNTGLAKMTAGKWQQSVTYTRAQFDCTRLTPDSIMYVEFDLDGEWLGGGAPLELIFQSYTSDPAIWAKIPPFEMTENSASFRYDDMLTMYGSDDFSSVDAIHIGDCDASIKVTKLTISNCTVPEITTTTEATTTTAATTAEETTTQAPAETTAATTAAAESSGGGQIPLIPIIIGAVVVAVVVVVIIIIKKNRKDFY